MPARAESSSVHATSEAQALARLAHRGRELLLRLAHRSRSPHVGSSLSCLDVLVTLYGAHMNVDPQHFDERDIFILSKAHGAMALYTSLRLKGFLDEATYFGYFQDGGTLPGHLDRHTNRWIEVSAGSLGHGFNLGLGMAYGLKLDASPRRVFTLIGDGESQEGSIWEGALFASKLGLGNFTAIMDFNNLQGYGRSRELCSMEPMHDKWQAFSWQVHRVDGHDFGALLAALRAPQGDRPKIIIADTIKGRGFSFMEDQLKWHYFLVSDEVLAQGLNELSHAEAALVGRSAGDAHAQ